MAVHSSGEATRIEVVNTLNLNDHGSRWISNSVYGNVYSFLSEKELWWGSAGDAIYMNGVNVPTPLNLCRGHHFAAPILHRTRSPHTAHHHRLIHTDTTSVST
jgi:hypothetical protein